MCGSRHVDSSGTMTNRDLRAQKILLGRQLINAPHDNVEGAVMDLCCPEDSKAAKCQLMARVARRVREETDLVARRAELVFQHVDAVLPRVPDLGRHRLLVAQKNVDLLGPLAGRARCACQGQGADHVQRHVMTIQSYCPGLQLTITTG